MTSPSKLTAQLGRAQSCAFRGMTIRLEFGNLKAIHMCRVSGVTIVQIHGAAEGATSLQLRMYDGDIKYYKYNVVATDLYDKLFMVNIIHNVGKGKIIVFIDVKKFVVKDQGAGDLYFKCGVYAAPENSSNYMESRWKEIKLYKK